MRNSVFPGDTMVIDGHRARTSTTDDTGCGWVELDVTHPRRRPRVHRVHAHASRFPTTPDDNPWDRRGDALAALRRRRDRRHRWISTSPPSRRCCARPSRGVCARYAASTSCAQMEDDPIGYPDKFWEQLAELGLLGLTLPEELRRQRHDDARRDGRVHGARARAGAVAALRELGDERRRARARRLRRAAGRVAPADRVRRGDRHARVARARRRLRARRACSSPRPPTATAGASTGIKRHVPFAQAADRLLVLARTADGPSLLPRRPEAPPASRSRSR